MTENIRKSTYCKLCSLQFNSKSIFAVHLSIVHKQKKEVQEEATICKNEAKSRNISFQHEKAGTKLSQKSIFNVKIKSAHSIQM